MEYPEYFQLGRSHWTPYNLSLTESTTIQFIHNLKSLKVVNMQCNMDKRRQRHEDLVSIRSEIHDMVRNDPTVFSSLASKMEFIDLVSKRKVILVENVEQWRLKSHVVWIQKSDDKM